MAVAKLLEKENRQGFSIKFENLPEENFELQIREIMQALADLTGIEPQLIIENLDDLRSNSPTFTFLGRILCSKPGGWTFDQLRETLSPYVDLIEFLQKGKNK